MVAHPTKDVAKDGKLRSVSLYGVRPGDRVAIGMRNYPEWVIAFAAITSIGAISVSLNARP